MNKKGKGLLMTFLAVFALAAIGLAVFFAIRNPVGESEPTAQPLQTPEVTPEPTEQPLEKGSEVAVEGTQLASGSVVYDDRLCVKLEELDAALYIHDGGLSKTFNYNGTDYIALDDACDELMMNQIRDEESGNIYCTLGAGPWQAPTGYKLPALMYHAVSDQVWGEEGLFVSPVDMEAQIVWLLDNGYQPIWFEDLRYLDSYTKPILLCFDDGYRNNYTELYPILQKYGVKATFFIIGGDVDSGDKYMTGEQLHELSHSGLVSLQCHSLHHPDLSSLSAADQEAEIFGSKLGLLRLTGKEPFVFCYPYGLQTAQTREIVAKYYKYGVMTSGDAYTTGGDDMQIFRMNVPRGMGIEEFAQALGRFTGW